MTTAIRPVPSASAPGTTLRSVGAIVAALLANVILSGAVDQVLHALGVFPPWGQVTYETVPYVLAISYRTAFGIVSGYVAARLAPRKPLRHAVILGAIGVVLCTGSIVASLVTELGPVWYPVVLTVVALPSAWLGGRIHDRTRA